MAGLIFGEFLYNWVVPEKIHTPPMEEISEGRINCL
jgi:hypothetical protein